MTAHEVWSTTHGDTVEVYLAGDGWRWRVRARNGEVVGSGEAHPAREDAVTAAGRHHPPVQATDWLAVASDRDGFVLDDETLKAWAAAVDAGKRGWDIPCEPPQEITIVRGSARPVPQSSAPDEDIYRLPGSWLSGDQFVEIENLDELEPSEVLELWRRAQAAAAGMNAAGVQ